MDFPNFPKLQARVVGILKNPTIEWRTISAEPDDIQSLYINYIIPLAAIPAIARFLAYGIIGVPFVGRFGFFTSLVTAIVVYVMTLVGVLVAAIVIEQLAPRFSSSGSTVDALKLVAYASTPVWVGGVIYLVIYLSPLIILPVIYAVYLFYLGLPPIMKTHPNNVVPFMLVSFIAIVVVNIFLGLVLWVFGLPRYGI
jgi:Yip1-like protein